MITVKVAIPVLIYLQNGSRFSDGGYKLSDVKYLLIPFGKLKDYVYFCTVLVR